MAVAPLALILASAPVSAQPVILTGDAVPLDPANINSGVDLEIGITGAGTLTIQNGGTLTNNQGYVGRDAGSTGTVLVTGRDGLGNASTWTNTGTLYVGHEGSGTLNVLAGGLVSSEAGYIGAYPGSIGVVTVSGDDGFGNASAWTQQSSLLVGDEGHGTLNVTLDGRVTTGARINIGNSSQGKIVVSDGSTVSSHDGVIGVGAYGEALLTSGASWTMASQMTIGLGAQGTLRIEDGARVTSNQGYVGANAGGDGSVTVTGAGSSWEITDYNLALGNYGTGTMTIADGARVFARDGVDLGISDVTASGTLNVLGTPGARGVLETSGIQGGIGTANVTLDGGIVRAIRNRTVFFDDFGAQQVTLGAAGGIIDTNGYSIGIAPEITGAGSLTKDGLGTLTLTGASSYAGGTTIAAGTLRLGNGGASGSIVGDVANSGILAFNRSDAVTFGGTITGTGGIHQIGTGQTTLTADSSGLLGVSGVYGGILSISGTGILGGTLEVVGGRLQGTGQVGTTTNFSGGTIAPGNSIGTLTVAGNYAGNGGTLEIETVLGDDSSATDLLVVTGDTSGSTNVRVINLGGTGAQTSEGIKIVDVGGLSGGNFTLLGNYTFEGDPAVVAGAYAYRLHQGSVSTPGDGDWYLRSALFDSPLYQAGAPVYEAYAAVLQSFNTLDTLQQRVGNRSWSTGVIDTGALPDGAGANSGIWSRIVRHQMRMAPKSSTTGSDYGIDAWQLQAGADGQLYAGEGGRLVGGLSLRHGTMVGDVTSVFGNGTVSSSGYGFGSALTWYGASGFYVDAQANLTLYDSTLASSTAGTRLVSGNGGFGYALGVEAGQRIALAPDWSVTPQAQLIYSAVNYTPFTDAFGAPVSLTDGNDLKIRIGVSADYQNAWTDGRGETSRLHAYGITNLYYDLRPQDSTELAAVSLISEQERLWGGLGLGGTYAWGNDKYALHGEATVDTGLVSLGSSYAISGTAGLTIKF